VVRGDRRKWTRRALAANESQQQDQRTHDLSTHEPCDGNAPVTTQHIFLIPGFFGFVNFGKLVYFTHVRDVLEDACARERMAVEIHRVRLKPTASLRVRAGELAAIVQELAPAGAPVHLIGHSTGGLDARLFTTPGVALDLDVEASAQRVRSVISVATPHRGTPLAAFFASNMGQYALRLFSLMTITILRRGRLPVGLMARLTASLARFAVRRPSAPLDLLEHLEKELIGTLPVEQRDLVGRFVKDVSGDQALIPQLTPAAMDMFDAATSDRPGVRYACVTATAAPPRMRTRLAFGPSPWKQATYALYTWLHGRVGDGDGIVPTGSQIRGPVLFEARGDHLDIIGHFDGPEHQPPHTDWLNTGSKFERAQFEALWTEVARFIAARR
jgi:triacylglycerol lipase